MPGIELETSSPEETEALGSALGRTARGGELLGLVGELGAGKTCLVRGLAAGLGIDPAHVHSPSFTIATEYRGGRLPLTHVDLYRLERPQDEELFFRDAFYGPGVAAVEWFNRLPPGWGHDLLLVTLCFTSGEGRAIHLDARGARHRELLERVRGSLAPPLCVPR